MKYIDLVKLVTETNDITSIEIDKRIKEITLDDIFERYKEDIALNQTEWLGLDNKKYKGPEYVRELVETSLDKEPLDVESFIEINASETIKTLLDEDSKHEVKSLPLLESSILTAYHAEPHPTELRRLAVVLYRLIKNHPFTNGNKRTAIVGVKTSFIIKFIKGFQKQVLDINLKYIDDAFKVIVTDKKIKKILENYPSVKKVTMNKISKTKKEVVSIIKRRFEKELISLDYYGEFLKQILKKWTEIFPEDYLLAIFIASQEGSNTTKDDLEKIYKIIELNILSFYTTNYRHFEEHIRNTADKVTTFIKTEQNGKSLHPDFFVKIYNNM